jgi:hypothetical protein
MAMKLVSAIFVALLTACSSAFGAEKRCGWYEMPTPGDLWLTDKDATWSITSQGEADGPDAEGAEKAPDFDPKQFVKTQGSDIDYGYGCACLEVETDAGSKRITRVFSGHTLPLATCKNDKSLPAR